MNKEKRLQLITKHIKINKDKKRYWKITKNDLLVISAILIIKGSFVDWYYIPSGSMIPTLQINDRVIASLVHYDYRIPFTNINILKNNDVENGDIALFKEKTSGNIFIKRILGQEGDTVSINGHKIAINGKEVSKSNQVETEDFTTYTETINDKEYRVQYSKKHDKILNLIQLKENNSLPKDPELHNFIDKYEVLRKGTWLIPDGYVFAIGDNRDFSHDSRFTDIGLIQKDKLIGKAKVVLANMKPLSIGDWSLPMIPTSFTTPLKSIYSIDNEK